MYVFMHVYQVYCHVTEHIFGVPVQILMSHCKYDPHSLYATWTPNIIAFVCQTKQTSISTSYIIAM